MTAAVPRSRPQLSHGQADAILRAGGVADGFGLLGIRGYYLDTMGQRGQNDRGMYDDAIMLITPRTYETYNANVDPSAHRKGIANLQPGLYAYQVGIHGITRPQHRRYKALVQASGVNLVRDGGAVERNVWRGINIHRGGQSTTSSEGCQTITPPQWDRFIGMVERELAAAGRTRIPYLLVDESTRRGHG